MVDLVRRTNGLLFRQNGLLIRASAASLAAYQECCCEGCCCPQFDDPATAPVTLTVTLRSADPCVDGHSFAITQTGSAECIRYEKLTEPINSPCVPPDVPINVNFSFICNGPTINDLTMELVGGTSGCGVTPVKLWPDAGATCDPLFVKFSGVSITDDPSCPSGTPSFDIEVT